MFYHIIQQYSYFLVVFHSSMDGRSFFRNCSCCCLCLTRLLAFLLSGGDVISAFPSPCLRRHRSYLHAVSHDGKKCTTAKGVGRTAAAVLPQSMHDGN